MNTEIFINKAGEIHNNKYDYSLVEYINALTKVNIICNECKIIFEQNPYNHLGGQGCKVCVDNNQRFTTEIFVKKSKELFNNFNYTLTNYVNTKTKIKIQCNSCKTIYEQLPSSHLKGIIHYEENEFFTTPLETVQTHDKIKYDYCKNNNIDLLVIKYTDFNNIENIIKNFIEKL